MTYSVALHVMRNYVHVDRFRCDPASTERLANSQSGIHSSFYVSLQTTAKIFEHG